RGISNIVQGLEECLYLGNMDALRDWGHAKDYVQMQWMMLQQESPDDFVIATGKQMSVREFVILTAKQVGIGLEFSGDGVNEIATVSSVIGENAPAVYVGKVIVRVDPRYFRPAEVENLLGDPSKARKKLGWTPETTVEDMCAEMVRYDLDKAKQNALLKAHGHTVRLSSES
ncbi:GDP-mannose 4,6-dehydratase, partial [Gammaproteobacteria bacterium]|nr:GDP-mannose 4,6-dehydratase [Gammaproteobacteria bacterium]